MKALVLILLMNQLLKVRKILGHMIIVLSGSSQERITNSISARVTIRSFSRISSLSMSIVFNLLVLTTITKRVFLIPINLVLSLRTNQISLRRPLNLLTRKDRNC